jgi:hypothetical protein
MISILCPTRKRPQNAKRLVQSIYDTATHPPAIHFYVDEGDVESLQYGPLLGRYFVGPRIVMSNMWNVLAGEAEGDILMLCGDDVIFQTPGWDEMVEREFRMCPDKILMVHGDDLGPNGRTFATLPFVSRKWIDTVGYFTPPGFSGDYADTWIDDVAKMIGRNKFVPIVVEHCHHIYGKAEYDETYREKDERQKNDNLEKLYKKRLAERIRDAEKLQRAMR